MRILVACVAVALIFTSPAFANMANGTYSHDFTGEVPLWDISGSYSDPTFGTNFNLTEDASGALTGAGTFDVNEPGLAVLNGSVTITGIIKGSSTAPKVSMKASIPDGTGTVVDKYGLTHNVTFTGKLTINYKLDGINHQLVVTSGSIQLKFLDTDTLKKRNLSLRIPAGSTLDLPIDSTGGWNLGVNVTPNGTKYTGAGSVETSTAALTSDYTTKGNYVSRTDTSKITLKRTGGSNLTLVVTIVGSDMIVKSAKGKLNGQTINFKAP